MYAHIMDWALSTPWAITPEMLAVVREVLTLRANGGRFTPEEIAARVGRGDLPKPRPMRGRGVEVIPVYGVLSQRMNLVEQVSGGTSTEMLKAQIRRALGDDTVGNIVLDIDSPGGSTAGIEELANLIYEGRQQKPIVAVANSQAASAAYWLAANATEVVAAPGAAVGSIGVYALHLDESQAMEQQGVRPTFISAGKYKIEGNPFEPLADEARAAVQRRVDLAYDAFVASVVRGRGVRPAEVRNGYGEGRTLHATDALAEGMVDRIATLDQTLERLGVRVAGPAGMAAHGEYVELVAVDDDPAPGDVDDLQNGSSGYTLQLMRFRARL